MVAVGRKGRLGVDAVEYDFGNSKTAMLYQVSFECFAAGLIQTKAGDNIGQLQRCASVATSVIAGLLSIDGVAFQGVVINQGTCCWLRTVTEIVASSTFGNIVHVKDREAPKRQMLRPCIMS